MHVAPAKIAVAMGAAAGREATDLLRIQRILETPYQHGLGRMGSVGIATPVGGKCIQRRDHEPVCDIDLPGPGVLRPLDKLQDPRVCRIGDIQNTPAPVKQVGCERCVRPS